MSIDTALARWRRGRSALATRAGSTITVTRPAGPGTLDPVDGSYDDPDTPAAVYAGPAIIRPYTPGSDQDSAGQEITRGAWTVHVHDLEATIGVGDRIEVTDSLQHPQLAGQTLTVASVLLDDWTVWPRVIATADTVRTPADGST